MYLSGGYKTLEPIDSSRNSAELRQRFKWVSFRRPYTEPTQLDYEKTLLTKWKWESPKLRLKLAGVIGTDTEAF